MAERNVRIEAAREGKTSTLKLQLQLKTPTLNPVKTTGDPFAANEAAWAAGNGLGAADAVTDGQPNLIRYVFGRPSGAFSPIAGITFQDGNPVLLFPSFNPDVSGVSLSILSTTNLLDWAHAEVLGPITPPSNFGGLILTHGYEAPSRLYRLKAEEQ